MERHLRVIASQHRVVLIAAFESHRSAVEVSDEGKLTEIRVFYKKRLPLLSYRKALRRGYRRALKYQLQYDLMHVHVAYPAGLLALELKLPYVISEHFSGYQLNSGFRWSRVQRKLSLRILKGAKVLLPVSDHLGRAMQKFGSSTPFQSVSNVVDCGLFKPGAETTNKRPVFLHISTLEERSKNITGILKGFKALEEGGHEFLLQIGGDGDLAELEEKIKSHGPSPARVEMIPPQSSAGIARLMQQADFYVMFSHYENQPCTILEALCTGTPVISSKVGGIAEVINDDNGLLIEPEDQQAFTRGLALMLAKKEQWQTQKIAQAARARFSQQAVLRSFNEAYASVLSSVPSGR